MGVHGLTKYITNDPRNFQDAKLHHTTVVFDANNYLNCLFLAAAIPTQYGGEYIEMMLTVREQLKEFADCSLTPIFVFDGCHDREGLMFNKLIKKRLDNIKEIQRFSSLILSRGDLGSEFDSSLPLPILEQEIFIECIEQMQCKIVQVERQADNHIAEIAVYLNSPLVSADSDFYIYRPVNQDAYRFIPISSLGSKGKCQTEQSQLCPVHKKACNYIPCKIFIPSGPSLGGIHPFMLPLLAVLIGNDFLSSVRLPAKAGAQMYGGRRIHALIKWISSKQNDVDGLLESILSLYDSSELCEITRRLAYGILSYILDVSGKGSKMASDLQLTRNVEGARGFREKSKNKLVRLANDIAEDVTLKDAVCILREFLSPASATVALNSSNSSKMEITYKWPQTLTNHFYKASYSSSLFEPLYVKCGVIHWVNMEDVNSSRSPQEISTDLRAMFYAYMIKLEESVGCSSKICGLEDGKVVEYRRCCSEIKKFLVDIPSLDLPNSSARTFSLQSLFKEHLHVSLPTGAPSRGLLGLSLILKIWYRNSQYAKASAVRFGLSPVGLAFAACAVTTHENLEFLLQSGQSFDDALIQLRDLYAQCASKASIKNGNPCSANSCIRTVHQISELQTVTQNLRQLMLLIEDLLDDYPQRLSDTEQFVHIWPYHELFPSCRLVYSLSRSLECVPGSRRTLELTRTFLPQLICHGLGKINLTMNQVVDQLSWILTSVEQKH